MFICLYVIYIYIYTYHYHIILYYMYIYIYICFLPSISIVTIIKYMCGSRREVRGFTSLEFDIFCAAFARNSSSPRFSATLPLKMHKDEKQKIPAQKCPIQARGLGQLAAAVEEAELVAAAAADAERGVAYKYIYIYIYT